VSADRGVNKCSAFHYPGEANPLGKGEHHFGLGCFDMNHQLFIFYSHFRKPALLKFSKQNFVS
jgi:hypothetical protein